MRTVQFRQPKPQAQKCVACGCEVMSNAIDPLCDDCTRRAEEAAAAEKAKREEVELKNRVTVQQLEVLQNACSAHGQAVQIADGIIDQFGGPEGFVQAWYADAMLILTGDKAGSALSQRIFHKIAEYQLNVSKISAQDLGSIDKMDADEVDREIRLLEHDLRERAGNGRQTA